MRNVARTIEQRGEWVVSIALVSSALLHGVVVLLGLLGAGWTDAASETLSSSSMPFVRIVDIDVSNPPPHPKPSHSAVAVLAPRAVVGLPSGIDIPRPDTGRKGRGGTDEVSQPGVNLTDSDQGISLVRSVASHIQRDQLPRVLSASIRRSWENQRLTTNPMELTFLASGKGDRQERRAPAARDPSSGTTRSRRASARGAANLGIEPQTEFAPRSGRHGARQLGSDYEAAGIGMEGRSPGRDHRSSANVAFARPMVDKGNPSVAASAAGRPQDNVDAAQQIARDRQSLVNASTAGGKPGHGPGGKNGVGVPGHGGVKGGGSRSQPLGYGPGSRGWSSRDPRLSLYHRHVRAKIWPYWEHAFPRWAAADMRQGRVIIALTILPDGSLGSARITRPSGIDEFDRNCLQAVHRAAPFKPFPRGFPLAVLHWELSFDGTNPVVR